MSKKLKNLFKAKNAIDKDLDELNNANKTVTWMLQFSKKVVIAAFVIFILSTIVEIILLFINSQNGDTSGFETFITETNDTFKVVVAGYCVKAAFENIIKITGSKWEKLLYIKYKLTEDTLSKETGINFDEEHTEDNDDDEDSGPVGDMEFSFEEDDN